jgi:hypothetical protein
MQFDTIIEDKDGGPLLEDDIDDASFRYDVPRISLTEELLMRLVNPATDYCPKPNVHVDSANAITASAGLCTSVGVWISVAA